MSWSSRVLRDHPNMWYKWLVTIWIQSCSNGLSQSMPRIYNIYIGWIWMNMDGYGLIWINMDYYIYIYTYTYTYIYMCVYVIYTYIYILYIYMILYVCIMHRSLGMPRSRPTSSQTNWWVKCPSRRMLWQRVGRCLGIDGKSRMGWLLLLVTGSLKELLMVISYYYFIY